MVENDQQKAAARKTVDGSSRRRFLVNSGYALGGLVVGGALGTLIKPKTTEQTAPNKTNGEQAATPKNYNQALMFFTQEQFQIAESAMERIFPEDDTGPGATSLGVAFFLDHQLAGEWGFNSRDYMSPPFFAGEKEQGYQGRLKRREIFEIGLRELENYSQQQYQSRFVKLTPEQQDEVLKAFESDTVKLTTISAGSFFKMLRSSTLEGAYSDPLYGGNANMSGWKMRNYPGSQMSYLDAIDKDFTKIEPSSLQDHLAMN
ncbi:gluconate 2-dehydrogenase subunit 3 family protein [Paenibacillus harenae]|uniref:Gluconate 2-dehydrogenase gamma chain n=1 Tax=Paenibacillus harenae TaxID=306543 RepID=A0ABT9U592_PAEHA|nr:gluconate 2-dehydrogenase subunit 3 family protein [Paenibacillus harenae]MDQ0114812.1 gluconate 2-dehydrogenase gamma chain [Paenibacillus harenae]